MNKEGKKLKLGKRELTVIFIITITISLFFSGYSMGKEYQNTSIKTNGEIAKPILVVENNPVVEVNGKNQKQYYNFKVKNVNEKGEITQIGLEYYIEILTKQEEAISFKLYKNDDTNPLPLENNKTNNMEMQKEKLQEDNYKLEIIYDKSKNYSIEDIIQDVQIKVHSEQVSI